MNQHKFWVAFLSILFTTIIVFSVVLEQKGLLKEEEFVTQLQSTSAIAQTISQPTTEITSTSKETTTKEITTKETTTEKKIILTTTTTIPETVQLSSQNTVDLGEFTLTAYCPCRSCSGPHGDSTSTGARAQPNHTIAVDPSIIPYYSHVIINGQEYVAEDCGGAVKNRKVDIYFSTHSEAEAFGLQHAHVYLIVE